MPFRRRSRISSRRPRRKTRWLTILPGAWTQNATNSFTVQGIGVGTAGPLTIPWAQLAGSTLLRVIMDFEANWDIVYASNAVTNVGDALFHVGLFMSSDENPTAAIWDPGQPSGDFMLRDRLTFWWRRESNTDLGATTYLGNRLMHMDTNVSRRIRENDNLFFSSRFFKSASSVVNGATVGFSGRVLIALP